MSRRSLEDMTREFNTHQIQGTPCGDIIKEMVEYLMSIHRFPDPWETLRILQCRSMRNKIVIALNSGVNPRTKKALEELVRWGIVVWVDKAALPYVAVVAGKGDAEPIVADIYLLTPRGVRLCEREGIRAT